MSLVKNNVLLICLSVLNGFSQQVSAFYENPQILEQPEIILEANSNYSLFCQGNQPLQWSTPEVKDFQKDWTHFREEPEQPTNPHFKFGLRLVITNISFPFVGYYYCHHKNVKKNTVPGSEHVYLFVNDTEHLSVLNTGNYIQEILVTKRDIAVIPCRPTSPDVEVTLATVEGSNVDAIYNTTTGFSFSVTDISQHTIYYCTFSRNGSETVDIFFNLIVESDSQVSYLPIPDLVDVSDRHTVVGNDLTLKCIVRANNRITFDWETPSGTIDVTRMKVSQQTRDDRNQVYIQNLTVIKTTLKDNGIYTCKVADYQNHKNNASIKVKIYDKDENFIIIKEPNDFYHTETYAGKDSVQWVVDVDGHPTPSVKWKFQRKKPEMRKGEKYEEEYDEKKKKAILVIKDITIHDMGTYVLRASNKYRVEEKSFFLNVTDKPTVDIKAKPFYKIGQIGTIKCEAAANPQPKMSWKYKACEQCDYLPIEGNITKEEGYVFTSEVKIYANQSGYVMCTAVNVKGFDEAVSGFFVSDVENGFDIFGFDDTVVVDKYKKSAIIAIGDPISMTCGASQHNYTDVTWYYNGNPIVSDDRHHMTTSNTVFSSRSGIEIPQSNYTDTGLYSCRVGSEGGYFYKNITIRVNDPTKPLINDTNLGKGEERNLPFGFEMYCKVYGIPKPTLTWYKDGKELIPHDNRVQISEDRERIIFNSSEPEDIGEYKCQGVNKMGSAFRSEYVKFKNAQKPQTWLFIIIVILSVLFCIAIVFIIIKLKKERDLQQELKKIGLAHFEDGEIDSINPNLGVDEQAELLPYDKKWEFPIDRLKLGKQLGSGAYGVVMKGEAKNIVDGENVTIVAVKMVKKNADHIHIKALASELKVMVHLGKHLNVVNLLGACTKNVAKRELLVIVEYCRFGNIQNYLIRHRNDFINQVDPKTRNLDYTIGQEFFDRTYSVSSNHSNPHSPMLKYAALVFSNSTQSKVLPPSNDMGDYRVNNSDNSANTQMTTVPQGEDGEILSNNSIQPEWRSNYRGDYKGHVKPISTKDLLAWAFQVARGMEYLASRKVLHGDLAARNILLSDNNIIKICDFGLAKSMYKSDNYKKSGSCLLPVKWMAIESIRDRVFSTQSDAWSFGIVLWEFFSLGRTPYPGMENDERLYHKLVDGYRMESPEYAPKQVYEMMTECWSVKPLARPTFTNLSERIGNLLEDTLRQHYVDLNDPYLKMNTKRLEEGQSDYLAMLSPPTFEVLSSPHYVNSDVIVPPIDETDGYLTMQPNLIFSPRATEDEVFDFNVNNRKNLNSENGRNCELLPMLNTVNESDSETPLSSPSPQGNSVSNPTYHHLQSPIREEDTNIDGDDGSDKIIKTSDNYISMSQNKNNFLDKVANNANTNPFVDVNNKKQEVHYVNEDTRDWGKVQL